MHIVLSFFFLFFHTLLMFFVACFLSKVNCSSPSPGDLIFCGQALSTNACPQNKEIQASQPAMGNTG
jgi:hypothetical protein